MAGIGEASAIIGVVQVGFSLARTLNTYIGDYKDSRDSIIGLAAELDATIIQVKELGSLVKTSKAASDGSKKLAEKCVKDSDRLIKKLVELLTKAHQPEDPNAIVNIKPEDINVSRLTRAYWPLIRPQVDVVKSELHVMKTDILIARSCIQSQTGLTPAERSAGGDSIVALAKSRRLAQRLLQEAKAEEKRTGMASLHRDPGPTSQPVRANSVDNPRPNGVPRHPRGPYASYDGRDTDLMARDLRDSILEDLQREDARRKAKEAADEEARKLAIEAYQKTVKDKLARLQEATDATQRRFEEIFGHALDEKQVKMFLSEQQSRQMQDEFGEMLLKFGVMPSMLANGSAKDARASPEEEGMRTPRRRWFSRRPKSRSSASSSTSTYRTTNSTSNPSMRKPAQFLHIALSYDSAEGNFNYQTFDNPALRHQPCGPPCDFEASMKVWQAVPRFVKQSASKWVEDNFSHRTWHLHAAIPIEKNVRKTRSLLQKAILGEVVHQTTSDVLLVFTSTDDPTASDADTLATTEDAKSVSSHATAPVSDGAASRIELSSADIGQMRAWLVSKGLSTKRIDELESLVAKHKDEATSPTQPTAAVGEQLPLSGPLAADGAHPMANNHRESSNTVRFVDGDVAPYPGVTIENPKGRQAYNGYPREESRFAPYGPQQVPRDPWDDYGGYLSSTPGMRQNSYSDYYGADRRSRGYYAGDDEWSYARRQTNYGSGATPIINVYNDSSMPSSRHVRHDRHETERERKPSYAMGGRGRDSSATMAIDRRRHSRDSSYDSNSSASSVPRRYDYAYDSRDRSRSRYNQPESEFLERKRPRASGKKGRSSHHMGIDQGYVRDTSPRQRHAQRKSDVHIEPARTHRDDERRSRHMPERFEVIEVNPLPRYETGEPVQLPASVRRGSRSESESRALRQRRASLYQDPSTKIRPNGTAVYDQPPSLRMPRASENERRPSSPEPYQLSEKRPDTLPYRHVWKPTAFSDPEDEKLSFRVIEREREPVRRHDTGSEVVPDPWSRPPRPYGAYPDNDARQVIDVDERFYRPQRLDHIQTRSNINAEAITIRKEYSPERIVEDAEDAENALLDDAELKKKMLSMYTSGVAPSTDPSPEDQRQASDDNRRRDSPSSQSGILGARRQNTVTVEDIEEVNSHDSDAGTGADRIRPSPGKVVPDHPLVEPTRNGDNTAINGAHSSAPERETALETTAPDDIRSSRSSEHDLRTGDEENAHDTDISRPPSPEERTKYFKDLSSAK